MVGGFGGRSCRPNTLSPPPKTGYIHCIPICFALDISYEGTRSAPLNLVGYGGVNFSIGSATSPIICSCSLSGKVHLNLCTHLAAY